MSPFVPDAYTAAPNDCTLRGAIFSANGNGAGADAINFNIPGSGVKTLILNNRLPDIQSSLTINGAMQTGYGGKPVIELNGNESAEFGLLIARRSVAAGRDAPVGDDSVHRRGKCARRD